jgi:hypothetical protein
MIECWDCPVTGCVYTSERRNYYRYGFAGATYIWYD